MINSHFDFSSGGRGPREAFKGMLAFNRACCTDRSMRSQERLMTFDGDYQMAMHAWMHILAAEMALADMDPGDVNAAKDSVQGLADLGDIEGFARSIGIDMG